MISHSIPSTLINNQERRKEMASPIWEALGMWSLLVTLRVLRLKAAVTITVELAVINIDEQGLRSANR
jgi:hypothetical protein